MGLGWGLEPPCLHGPCLGRSGGPSKDLRRRPAAERKKGPEPGPLQVGPLRCRRCPTPTPLELETAGCHLGFFSSPSQPRINSLAHATSEMFNEMDFSPCRPPPLQL